MNELFEKFVYRQLKKLEREYPNLQIKCQERKKFWETREIKPDILVKNKENQKQIVLDTKWKVIRDLKPADNDLKKMYVYNDHFD